MKKIKLFPAPHVEIRIHVSEEMERDYAECQKMMKRGEDYDCDRCSWANVSIYGTGACELKGLKEQLGGISGETDGKEREWSLVPAGRPGVRLEARRSAYRKSLGKALRGALEVERL